MDGHVGAILPDSHRWGRSRAAILPLNNGPQCASIASQGPPATACRVFHRQGFHLRTPLGHPGGSHGPHPPDTRRAGTPQGPPRESQNETPENRTRASLYMLRARARPQPRHISQIGLTSARLALAPRVYMRGWLALAHAPRGACEYPKPPTLSHNTPSHSFPASCQARASTDPRAKAR